MKLDRLLAITMTLLNKTRVSAAELAERFEVTPRTIYRDMEAINLAGIPIVSFAGSDGGYEIMPGYRLDKQLLSMDDFSSIISALRGARSATESTELDRLLERIGALASGEGGSGKAGNVDLDFTPVPNDKEKIGPLRKAMKELRLVRFGYWDNRGAETVRTMEPMGLFLKGYIWYLYGYCRSRSDYRVFRLSRMTNLEVLSEAFVRRDYTLEDVERQFMAKADFARVKAELHFHPSVRTRVRDEFGYDPVTSHPDGSVSVNASYSSLDKAVRSILSYSSLVTVLGPPEVREEVRRHVAELAKLYEV